ncbi:hypothetical protein [Legionella bozemanae]|uniref:hypothetical protein n=1 Tax=Legionella bozemanae TaxID=447 RepID=UPI000AE7A0D1|nr:hypothetical protein [Legionella bozemanae]
MTKHTLLKNWRGCLLISVTLLCSCVHPKDDIKNETSVNKSFGGYRPHGHGHGHH